MVKAALVILPNGKHIMRIVQVAGLPKYTLILHNNIKFTLLLFVFLKFFQENFEDYVGIEVWSIDTDQAICLLQQYFLLFVAILYDDCCMIVLVLLSFYAYNILRFTEFANILHLYPA